MKLEARIHPTSKDSLRSCQAVSKLVRMGVGVRAVPHYDLSRRCYNYEKQTATS